MKNHSILTTESTGFFRQAFVSEVFHRFPKSRGLVVFSRNEFKQFEMQSR